MAPPEFVLPQTAVEAPEPSSRLRLSPVIVLVCLGLAYVIGYGWLLQSADYIPYVTDNNESFSVLAHASNLYNFGLDKSFGLTDESFSPDAAAHPYVYTHGGNFPRLYGYVLYRLGARTIESQITIATFTIGALGMLALFNYFYIIAGLRFATLAALIFGTDYLFFAQWQVNSYRVWHTVFIFGALLAVHGVLGSRRLRWLWVLAMYVLYGCLFYFDITFGVFVGVVGGVYAFWLLRRDRLRLLAVWVAAALGSASSIAILVVQDILYMGSTAFLQDMAQTYTSRNNDPSDITAANQHLADLVQFYARQHIVFWQQFGSSDAVRDPGYFVQAIFEWALQPMTPLFTAIVFALVTSAVVVAINPTVCAWWNRRVHIRTAISSDQRLVLLSAGLGIGVFGAAFALVLLQAPLHDQSTPAMVFWTIVVFATALGVCLFSSRFRWSSPDLPIGRVVLAVLGLGFVAWVASGGNLLYDATRQPLALLGAWIPEWIAQSAALVAVVLAALMMLCGARSVLGVYRAGPVLTYLSCTLIGFAATYFLLPGYVLSEYLTRMTPLVVYVRDVAVVLAADIAFAALIHAWRGLRYTQNDKSVVRYRSAMTAAVALVSVFLAADWLGMQWQYLHLLPPTGVNVYNTLQQPPFKGASFALKSYAAPVAAATGQWAYFDQSLDEGTTQLTDLGYDVTRDAQTYLWFADRETNPAYSTPDYYLCFTTQYLDTAVQRLRGQPDRYCSNLPLVKYAAASPQTFPRDTIVASDPSGRQLWTIVKLDWNYPPYLRRLPGTLSSRYVQVESDYSPTSIHIHPRFDPQQQTGTPLIDPLVRTYWTSQGSECLLAEGHDASGVDLPLDFWGLVRIAVTPRTSAMSGQEFSSDPVQIGLMTFQLPDTLRGGVQTIKAPSLEAAQQQALAAGTWNPQAGTLGDSSHVVRQPNPPPPAGPDGRCVLG